ncbi:Mitochondrial import inner membrane translocase subunit Tim10 [Dirofilaria immitis]|nr:Mitochondrial import inner membrane translocase subunit Tim10 [Dirofilaria immitis]
MSQAQLQMVADLEIEMMSDMYRRMTTACQQKCISTRYRNFWIFNFQRGELTKGEAVCLDRCVAKYLDVHEKLGKKLTSISQQDEKQLQQMQQQMQQQLKQQVK